MNDLASITSLIENRPYPNGKRIRLDILAMNDHDQLGVESPVVWSPWTLFLFNEGAIIFPTVNSKTIVYENRVKMQLNSPNNLEICTEERMLKLQTAEMSDDLPMSNAGASTASLFNSLWRRHPSVLGDKIAPPESSKPPSFSGYTFIKNSKQSEE